MDALVLHAANDIRLETVDAPHLEDGDLLVRVKCASICGTDLRYLRHGMDGLPIVLGHEFSGVIEAITPSVTGFHVGDRVAVAPNFGCGICDYCVSGNTQLCEGYQAFGINLPGAFAEYVRIPGIAVRQGNVARFGDTIGFDEAAVVEPLSCVYNGFEKCMVRPGETVLVIGAGPIGVMHAMVAFMGGAGRVLLHDKNVERLQQSQQAVPSMEICAGEDLRKQVMDATNGRGVDVCITACPSPEAQRDSLGLMAVGGRINFFGGIPKSLEPVPIDTNVVHYRQLILTGSARSSLSQYRRTLQLLETGRLSLQRIITHHFDFADSLQAFASTGAGNGLKTVLHMDR